MKLKGNDLNILILVVMITAFIFYLRIFSELARSIGYFMPSFILIMLLIGVIQVAWRLTDIRKKY